MAIRQNEGHGLTMGFFDDVFGLTLGFMAFDELGKDKERERKKQEFLNDLLLNAAAEGLTYTDSEIQEILADSERLGLFD